MRIGNAGVLPNAIAFIINHRRCRTSSRRTGRFTRANRCVHRRLLHDALSRYSGAARGRPHRTVESITRGPAQESRESPGSDFLLFQLNPHLSPPMPGVHVTMELSGNGAKTALPEMTAAASSMEGNATYRELIGSRERSDGCVRWL